MVRGCLHAFLAFVWTALIVDRCCAEETGRRLALVVGNSAYSVATQLPNAAADARLFADFLKKNGFEVDVLVNVSRADFAKGLSQFSSKLNPSDTALFYYAGHGMQLKGENYLLGLDAQLQSEFDVDAETVSLNSIIATLERKAAVSMLFIDACRNNPLADRLIVSVEGSTRGLMIKGLAPVNTTGSGTMIAFSASPGQVAFDGGGENSPFTKALVEHLDSPSVEVGTAFKRVIRDVRQLTSNAQSPQLVSNIASEFYFNASAAVATAGGDPALMLAQIDFDKAERISTARGWELFLAKHGEGALSDSARTALSLLEADSSDLVSPQEAENRMKLSQAQRKEIQLTLLDLGYDVGQANGKFSEKTRRALARYQKALGLTETGYVSRVLANRLEIVGVSSAGSVVSADEARKFDPEDLKGLETDERVIRAAQCLSGREIIYGEFGSHLYVAVMARGTNRARAQEIAEKCGTHLVAINSKAENDFVYDLFKADDRMFNTGFDTYTKYSFKMGPWIGLAQAEGGREPRGGWGWDNGEKVTFSGWKQGWPIEHKDGDDWATYFADKAGQADMASIDARTWGDMGPTDDTNSFVLEFE